jgi:Na+/proline symporter
VRYLNPLDYGIIGAYCALLLILSLSLWRRASRSLEHYFLAGRNMPWWALGISGMASYFDMAGTMVIVSFLYMLGPRGLYVEFRGGAVLLLAFMLLWTGKWHFRSGCMTGAEWQIFRFGSGSGAQFARVITAVANIVSLMAMITYIITGAGLFLSMFLPYSPLVCALLMVGVTTVYTVISGFYGVVYNDILQAAIVLVGAVTLSILGAVEVRAHPGELSELARRVTGNPDWLSSWPQRFTPISGAGGTEYEPMQFLAWVGLLGFLRAVLGGFASGTNQRFFGARSERDCGLLSFFWIGLIAFRWPMMIAFAVLGLFLVDRTYPDPAVLSRAAAMVRDHVPGVAKEQWLDTITDVSENPDRYPRAAEELRGLLGPGWQQSLQLVSHSGGIDPERILPAVILMSVPSGLRGLFVVALVAAAMSSLSPRVNDATSYFVRDLWQAYLHPRAGNRELILVSYVFGVALVGSGFVFAYYVRSINDVWGWISMGLGAGLSVPQVLRLYWWRFNGTGFFGGTLAGLCAAVLERALVPDWPPGRTFFVALSASLIGSLAGTWLGAPADRAVLERFYRLTRPFGWWGPLRSSLSPELGSAADRENRRDLAALPFALLWQITLFLLPMQAVIGAWSSFWPTLVLWLVGLSGVLWFWYRHLPSKAEGAYPASRLLADERPVRQECIPALPP